MERRLQQRTNSQQLRVEISDGLQSYDGVVSNLTYTGVAIEGLPQRIDLNSQAYNLTIHDNEKRFELRAVPRWSTISETHKSMGAKIYEVPRSWYQFVDSLDK